MFDLLRFRKGQVTIFVVLGLIVLIVAFISIFFLTQSRDPIEPVDVLGAEYSEGLQPLVNDIRYCLSELGKEIFLEIGFKGGNTNTLGYVAGLDIAYLNDALELIPGSGEVIPYWFYFEGDPGCLDCGVVYNIPSLTGAGAGSISSQVESFVEANLVDCVSDFSQHSELEIRRGEPSLRVIFREDDVFFDLDWYLNVSFPDGSVVESRKYSQVIDLRFKQIYSLAVGLFNQMRVLDDDPFLESAVLEILSIAGLGGPDAIIPPLANYVEQGSSSQVFWLKHSVSDIVRNLVFDNINAFQVVGSRGSMVSVSFDPVFNSIHERFQFTPYFDSLPLLEEVKVRFDYYPIWPFYLDIPQSGEFVAPRKQSLGYDIPFLGDLGTTEYSFAYDVVFPVLMSFEELDAFNGEGYKFMFPFTVNIVNNVAKVSDLNFSASLSVDDVELEEFGSFDQRTVPVTVSIVDGYTGALVSDGSLKYTCGSQSLFLPGPSQGDLEVDLLVPPCMGGYFSVEGVGFYAEPVMGNFLIDEEYDVAILYYPERDVTVSFRQVIFEPLVSNESAIERYVSRNIVNFSRDWEMTHSRGSVSDFVNESITAMFLKVDSFDDSFFKIETFEYPYFSKDVPLVPGDYEVTIFSVVNFDEPLVIDTQVYTFEVGSWWDRNFGTPETEHIVLEEVSFNDSILLGVLEFEGENLLSLSVSDVLNLQRVSFVYPVFDYDKLQFHQDLEVLDLVTNASNMFPDTFRYYLDLLQ